MAWWTKYTNEQIDQALENALNGGTPAASLIHQASGTLDDDDIATLPSQSVDIIPACPSGFRRFNVGGNLKMQLVSGYGNVAGGTGGITALFIRQCAVNQLALGAQFAVTPNLVIPLFPAGKTYVATDPEVTLGVVNAGEVSPDGTAVSEACYIAIDNYDAGYSIDQGNFTGGDPANVVIVTILFLMFDFATGAYLTTDESGWNPDTRTFAA